MKKTTLLAAAMLVTLAACHPKFIPPVLVEVPTEIIDSPPPPPVAAPEPLSRVLEFTRTNCMGKCKNYTFVLYSNGNAEYTGKANVARMGKHFARLTPEQLAQIKTAASTANIVGLSDKYPTNGKWITDMPSVLIDYDGKKIRDNYDSPKALQDFEKQIDNLIENLDWKIVD